MREATFLLFSLASACLNPVTPAWEVDLNGDGTTFLIVFEDGRAVDGWVDRTQSFRPAYEQRDNQTLWLISVDAPLDTLALNPGRLALDPLGGPLPQPILAAYYLLPGAEALLPAPPSEITAQLGQVRVRGFDYVGCLARDGCISGNSVEPRCQASCSPTAPAPPEPPRLPGPADWVVDAELSKRLEFSRPQHPQPIACASDQYQPYGAKDCAPIAPACQGWPSEAVDAYVDPRASPAESDGSAQHPWTTIDAALAAPIGALRLALAAGRHPAPSALAGSIALIGVCSETVVAGPIVLLNGALTLQTMTVESATIALAIRAGTATVDRVTFTSLGGAGGPGIDLRGGALSTSVAVVRGFPTGIRVQSATVELRDSLIESSGGHGLDCAGPAALAQLTRTQLRAQGTLRGIGVKSRAGCAVKLDQVVVEGHASAGMDLQGTAVVSRSLIRNNRGLEASEEQRYGLRIADGSLDLSETELSQNGGGGLLLDNGSTATLNVVRVIGNGRDGDRPGLLVADDAQLEAHNLVVAQNVGDQLRLQSIAMPEHPSIWLEDLAVIATQLPAADSGLSLGRKGPVWIRRAWVQGGPANLLAITEDGLVDAEDLTLWPEKVAINVLDGGDLALRRLRVVGGTRPLIISSRNRANSAHGEVEDLDLEGAPETVAGLEIGRANLALRRYRLQGSGQRLSKGSALLVSFPPLVDDLGVVIGTLVATSGWIGGWKVGVTLADPLQGPDVLGELQVEDCEAKLKIVVP